MLCGANMDFVCDTRSRSGLPICRNQSGHHICIKCGQIYSGGGSCQGATCWQRHLPGRVPAQKTCCILVWCVDKSRSSNSGNELTEVGGVLLVVIR